MEFNKIISNLRPEDKLILSCLQHQQIIPKLDFDESLLIHRMGYHHVTSMIYKHLLSIDSLGILSNNTQAQLKHHYYLNIARNMTINYLVQNISNILATKNIKIITLKGGMFIQLFPNYALLREMSDLDIMVKSDQLDQALNVLFATGFKDSKNRMQKPNWYSRIYENAVPIKSLQPDIPDITIELHWQLFGHILNNTYWSEQELWQRAKYCSEQKVYHLDPIDILLHLCAHQCNNLHIYLYSLVDVSQVLHTWRDEIIWSEVFYRAKSQRLLLHVVNILRLGHELLNISLPDQYSSLFQSYEQQAEPGYYLLLERLFVKEATESPEASLSIEKVFRRLEYSNFWQRLWYGYIRLFLFSLIRFFRLGSCTRSFSHHTSMIAGYFKTKP